MSLPIHLQLLLGDRSVSVVRDNALTHGERQRQRQPLTRYDSTPFRWTTKRQSRNSRPIQMGSLKTIRDAPTRRGVCRWESTPTMKKYSKDCPPVLTRRMKNSTITLANSLRPRNVGSRDVPPVCRRPVWQENNAECHKPSFMDILEDPDSDISLQDLESTMDIVDLLTNSIDVDSMHTV